MKQFELDWGAFLAVLPAWDALDVGARRALLAHLKPATPVQPRALGAHLDALRQRGWVEDAPTGARVQVPETRRPAVRALRAMGRHRIFDAPSAKSLAEYLAEHFTSEETELLMGYRGYGGAYGRGWLAEAVAAEEWVAEFLDAPSAREGAAWERARSLADRPALAVPERFAAAQSLVRELLPHPAGVPLAGVAARRGTTAAARALLGEALHAALRLVLVYAALRGDDLEPVLGVWPEIARRATRVAPPPPAPVEPVEPFTGAFLLEDMTTVLAAAAADPIRLRGQDHAIFARTQKELDERLLAVPPWVFDALKLVPAGRVPFAVDMLGALQLVAVRGAAGTNLRLAATPAGMRWLAQPDRDRLAVVVDAMRKSKHRNPLGPYDAGQGIGFFPSRFGYPFDVTGLDLRAAATRAFLALPDGAFVPLDAFLQHQRESANPLLAAAGRGGTPQGTPRGAPRASAPGYFGARLGGRADWEYLWGEVLTQLLAVRLAPLGAVALGRLADGRAALALTDVGRYLFGAAPSFAYGGATTAGGEAIVQPNFDVVFLAPAPLLEARLARVAERAGRAPGVAFRLTRASVLGAADAGTTLDGLLELLAGASAYPLPPNVARQLRDWYATIRRVALRPALLIDCPDAETAARVRSAAGKDVRPVSDRVLESPALEPRARTALVKRLRSAGVFIDE